MKKRFPFSCNFKTARTMLCTALITFSVTGCAYDSTNKFEENGIVIYDPMEEQNRKMMAFNQSFDHTILNPMITGYRAVTPKPARTGIRNVLRHLGTPVVLTNQILQGDLSGAGKTTVRGVVNTFVGLGGLIDVAAHEGIEYESEDFGQTLGVWGVGYGPYMVVPIIGPSSMRDYSGYFADSAMDPLRWYLSNIDRDLIYMGKFSASYFDLRESLMDTLLDVENNSIDYYATVRSIYYQNRQASILDKNKTTITAPAIPDYDDEDFDY